MTPEQRRLVAALGCVTFTPGHPDKRFAGSMMLRFDRDDMRPLTERQASYLQHIAWKYRRQLPASVVPCEKPLHVPLVRRTS